MSEKNPCAQNEEEQAQGFFIPKFSKECEKNEETS